MSWYNYRDPHVSASTEAWLSDLYVCGSGLSLIGALVVLSVIRWEESLREETSPREESASSRLAIVCLSLSDAGFALVVMTWRALNFWTGSLYCNWTQPISVTVETWSILWSATVALSLGTALRTRDEKAARAVASRATFLIWPLGLTVGASLAVFRDNVSSSLGHTCQYRRKSLSYALEVGAQLASWITVCLANAFAVSSSSRSLRNAPGRVADRHMGQLFRFSIVGVTLWGCRLVADLARDFPGRYNLLALLWIMPGFQGCLNAIALGTGPLRRSFTRCYRKKAQRRRYRRLPEPMPRPDIVTPSRSSKQTATSDDDAHSDLESPSSNPSRIHDSLVRHLCFNEEKSVKVAVRYPYEEEQLAKIAEDERRYRTSRLDNWLLRHKYSKPRSMSCASEAHGVSEIAEDSKYCLMDDPRCFTAEDCVAEDRDRAAMPQI